MKGIIDEGNYYFSKPTIEFLYNSNGKSHVSLIKMNDIIVKTYFGKNDHH